MDLDLLMSVLSEKQREIMTDKGLAACRLAMKEKHGCSHQNVDRIFREGIVKIRKHFKLQIGGC